MTSELDFSFPVEDRLKHKRLFEQLFTKGKRSFKFPVLAIWGDVVLPEGQQLQVGFVAPKKHYKTAVERNRIKRWFRESYRTQKHTLEAALSKENRQVAILFIAVKTDNISFDIVRPKILLLLQEIGQQKHDR
jgi:ribonuclease P protein component